MLRGIPMQYFNRVWNEIKWLHTACAFTVNGSRYCRLKYHYPLEVMQDESLFTWACALIGSYPVVRRNSHFDIKLRGTYYLIIGISFIRALRYICTYSVLYCMYFKLPRR